MARKLFVALEEEQLFVNDEQPVEMDMLENNEEMQEITEQVEVAQQAKEVAETIAEIEAAKTPEEAVAIAVEHLTRSIGYTKKYAIESFKVDLEQQLVIAQEGVMGRVGNAFKRAFTSDRKLGLKLKKGLETLKEKGSKTEPLKDPSWSKYLALKNKDLVTGADTIAFVKDIYGKVEGDSTVKTVTAITKEIINLKTIKDGKFTQEESTAFFQRIAQLREKMAYFSDTLKLKYTNSDKESYPDFQPLTNKEAEQLSSFIKTNFLIDDEFEKLVENAEVADDKYNTEGNIGGAILNLIKFVRNLLESKESKQYKKLASEIDALISQLLSIQTFYQRMSYAVIRYIEDSAAK